MLSRLHVDELTIVRHSHHHPVTIDIADGARKVEIADLRRTRIARILINTSEKRHRPAELEIVLYLFVALSEHFHHELVQRVIVALAHLQRIPGIAAFHLPLQSHLLGLLAESLFLSRILHLEQQPLLLKRQYRRSLLISHNRLQRYDNFMKTQRTSTKNARFLLFGPSVGKFQSQAGTASVPVWDCSCLLFPIRVGYLQIRNKYSSVSVPY